MTNSLIPNIFVAGTKARAEEVNANFSSLAEAIETNAGNVTTQISQLNTTLTASINNVSTNCSDINLLKSNYFTNAIIEAPNGVMTYTANVITVKDDLRVIIPNGTNTNGSLKSLDYTTTEEQTIDVSLIADGTYYILIDDDGVYLEAQENSAKATLGKCKVVSGEVNNIVVREVMNVLKTSDKESISSYSFPSNDYVDLTLGAALSTYVAPANGWFFISKNSTGGNQYISMYCLKDGKTTITDANMEYSAMVWYPNAGGGVVLLPIRKGKTMAIDYNAAGVIHNFRFMYAEGEV